MSQGQRKLAAIMFTDMIGYTALGQRNEYLSIALVDEQRKIIRPVLARHNGREVKTIGDGFLVEFPNALDAVRCAYDIQRATREFNISLQPEQRLHLRIGVHDGDVVETQGDLSGDTVNIASRIEPLAEDGGVCVTREVYEHVKNKIELPMSSMGEVSLKNVSTSMEVYKMIMPWEKERLKSAQDLDSTRVAVLPFESMSPDPNDDYFADGLTEELIGRLCQVRGLGVIARTSVMSYKKKKEKRAAEIAKELNVGSLVEGSVRKAGARIRVTAQLINAISEEHLWSSHYDKDLDDIFAVQSDIAEKVANELKIKLLDSEKKVIEKKDTEDTLAYTYFLKGMQLVYQLDQESLRNALSLFEQAIARDPLFARAYAGIARCYTQLASRGYISFKEGIEKGRKAAKEAIDIDPLLPEAHNSMAWIMAMADEVEGWRRELERSLELNPNLAEAYILLVNGLVVLGTAQEFVEAAEKAYQLSPLSPGAIDILGRAYFWAGRNDEALDHWRKTLHLEPYRTYRNMFDYYASKGDYEQAEKIVAELERIGPNIPYTYLNKGYLAALRGDTKMAHEMITKLDFASGAWAGKSNLAGFIYLALGDLDKFFEYMFSAADVHAQPGQDLRCNPLLEMARKDPRIVEVFKRAGLPYKPLS